MMTYCSTLLSALLLAGARFASGSAKIDWQWKSGRASWYGNGDWPIHIGGCGYDYLWKDEGTGWDVAALADVSPDYYDSCGLCYEIACDPTWTSDYYGEKFDRSRVCYDSSASVVVRIVDTCQCTYPANWWSNKRWCCGDKAHFDVSMWAFEKLAELRWGVIALKYRAVPCGYKPSKPAAELRYPSPGIPVNPPANAVRQARDWPDFRSTSIQPRPIFGSIETGGALQNGFYDISWKASLQSLSATRTSGMLGGPGMCARVANGGALALKAWNGVFSNAVALEFWIYVGVVGWEGTNATIPDITVSIGGDQGGCAPVRLMNLKPTMFQPKCVPFCADYWWRYRVYLPVFGGAWPRSVINNPASFQGCGGMSSWQLNQIQFRHDGYGGSGDKYFCLDNLSLS